MKKYSGRMGFMAWYGFTLGAAALMVPLSACATGFSFVALGDAPYGMPQNMGRFESLTNQVSSLRPDFAVHVGDIKGGCESCKNETFHVVRDLFAKFQVPLVYTPGDNDWTDCSRSCAGSYDPIERLAFLRSLFFQNSCSLADPAVSLVRQSDVQAEFSAFVENARWTREGMVFATLHVVGSNNNLLPDLPAMMAEYEQRNRANLAWMEAVFAEAERTQAPAVVLFIQADMQFSEKPEKRTGFNDTIDALATHAQKYGKPVLLVNGDTHIFLVDQPIWVSDEKLVSNVMRLQVPGNPFVQGVRVLIDPTSPQPFTFQLLPGF